MFTSVFPDISTDVHSWTQGMELQNVVLEIFECQNEVLLRFGVPFYIQKIIRDPPM